MKIYTKTGDKGETSLLGGERVSKSNVLVHVYGSVDELNSSIGLAAVNAHEHKILLHEIQSALFDLGALLSCPIDKREKFKLKKLNPNLVEDMESEIDKMNSHLDELKSFIIPGGHESSARFHWLRAVSRRVERELVNLFEQIEDDESNSAIMFINRLSDLFFVMARYYNKKNSTEDVLWNP